jgi:hypothetical protein
MVECYHTECRLCCVSLMLSVIWLHVVMLSVVILSVVAPPEPSAKLNSALYFLLKDLHNEDTQISLIVDKII